MFHRGETLDDLAHALDMDPGTLKQTVQTLNAAAGTSARAHNAAPLRAPYYALGPVRNYINYTDGGLAINSGLQVLGANDFPIPRLYAAGATGQGGLLLKGHGNHLGWGFTSGRLAGNYAAQREPRAGA